MKGDDAPFNSQLQFNTQRHLRADNQQNSFHFYLNYRRFVKKNFVIYFIDIT